MIVLFFAFFNAPFILDRETPQVQSCLEYLNGPRSRDVNVGLQRSIPYVETFRKTFRQEGVPEDLIWLALIESGFDPIARSVTGAQGMFQFKANTARAFGLEVSADRDDRNQPLLAARACARYLAYLYRKFGDWDLVLAAYNLGEGDLVRTMRSASAWTWKEVRTHVRLETRTFVPKVKAAAILGNRYLETENAKKRLNCTTYSVKKGDTLYGISRSLGLDIQELKAINDLDQDTIYVGQILIIEND